MARPSKGEDAKRRIITMRVTERDAERIASAADENGRSVSQEIESRLERSFERDQLRGGAHIAVPVELLGNLIAVAEQQTGKRWTDDYLTWVAVKGAAMVLFNANRPPHRDSEAIRKAESEYLDVSDRLASTSPLGADYSAALEARDAARLKLRKVAATAKEDAQVGDLLATEHIAPLLRLSTKVRR